MEEILESVPSKDSLSRGDVVLLWVRDYKKWRVGVIVNVDAFVRYRLVSRDDAQHKYHMYELIPSCSYMRKRLRLFTSVPHGTNRLQCKQVAAHVYKVKKTDRRAPAKSEDSLE